jgi:hypothetical protein
MATMDFSDLHISLPNRAKIFMSALWFWTYIMFYMSKCINVILRLFITYTPDSMIIFKNPTTKQPKILSAHIHHNNTNKNITNKIATILSLKWDSDISNENGELLGGLNMCDILDIYPAASNAVIWLAYLLEVDNKISTMSDEDLGKKIKIMLIDFKKRTLYRTSDLSEQLKANCGEIPF